MLIDHLALLTQTPFWQKIPLVVLNTPAQIIQKKTHPSFVGVVREKSVPTARLLTTRLMTLYRSRYIVKTLRKK